MPSFFSSRKAQGLSLNVIIVAVIALIVLVVLVFIFTGKTRLFSQTTADCASKGAGAQCKDSCGDGEVEQLGTDCASKEGSTGKKCCVPFD